MSSRSPGMNGLITKITNLNQDSLNFYVSHSAKTLLVNTWFVAKLKVPSLLEVKDEWDSIKHPLLMKCSGL